MAKTPSRAAPSDKDDPDQELPDEGTPGTPIDPGTPPGEGSGGTPIDPGSPEGPLTPSLPAAPAEGMVRVTVAEGRAIQYHVQTGTRIENGNTIALLASRTALPGQMVDVTDEDYRHLSAAGFLHRQVPPPPPTPEPKLADDNRGRTTINGDDGSVVRAGR
jgi:hypothetical protein